MNFSTSLFYSIFEVSLSLNTRNLWRKTLPAVPIIAEIMHSVSPHIRSQGPRGKVNIVETYLVFYKLKWTDLNIICGCAISGTALRS